MTKARTKSGKRASRRAAVTSAGISDLPPIKRKKRGKARMQQIAVERDADVPAIAARCKQIGINADEAGMIEAKAEWMGCNAGRAMASVVKETPARVDLWAAIHHMRRVQIAYDRALGAPSRHAKCLQILLPLDEMHADAASPPADLRTDTERHVQAVTAWMRVQGWLGHADKGAASVCKAVVIDDTPCYDATAMVAALRCVVDGIAGRRIVYKGA